MKTSITALAVIAAIIAALAVGITAAVFISTANAEPQVQQMVPPLSKPKPMFIFDMCATLPAFVSAMKNEGGVLATSGEIPNRIISVIVFPDTSFGVFTYNPVSDIVCLISTGWFVQPGVDA